MKDEYLYSPDLLIAPILYEGAVLREVYLPPEGSNWTDARTGRIFEGGQTILVEAPLSTIPVFFGTENKNISSAKYNIFRVSWRSRMNACFFSEQGEFRWARTFVYQGDTSGE